MMQLLEAFIALRRATGGETHETARALRCFVRFATERGDTHLRAETAIAWAAEGRSPDCRNRRISAVIAFARYLRGEDERHELPPRDIFPFARRKPVPYIYSPAEIRAILAAAGELKPIGSSRADTYQTMLGLLAATGLRLGEAMRLLMRDLTSNGLLIRESKFDKTRLVPLHESTRIALTRYCGRWRSVAGPDDPLFISTTGNRLSQSTVHYTFLKIVRELGLYPLGRSPGSGPAGPRMHDLRHTFAVRSLESCAGDRHEIRRHALALMTYLGHSTLHFNYYYLHATPQLTADIADACERFFEGGEI